MDNHQHEIAMFNRSNKERKNFCNQQGVITFAGNFFHIFQDEFIHLQWPKNLWHFERRHKMYYNLHRLRIVGESIMKNLENQLDLIWHVVAKCN
jgi:hypothetical protein